MDLLDRASLSPADDTLVQSQAILFAAALFIGCTIFDAQNIGQQLAPLAKLLPAHGAAAAPAQAQPVMEQAAPAAPQAVATAKPQQGLLAKAMHVAERPEPRALRATARAPHDKPVVYKGAWVLSQAPAAPWHSEYAEALLAAPLLARID